MSTRQEELQTITTSSLGGLIEARIADEVQLAAREVRITDSIVVVNRELVGKPSNTLDFYKRGAIKIGSVAEGGTFPVAEPAYSKILTIGIEKQGGRATVTHEAVRDGRVDLINDCKTELGEALANRKDLLTFRDGAFGGVKQAVETLDGDGSKVKFVIPSGKVPFCHATAFVDSVEVAVAAFDPLNADDSGDVTLAAAPDTGTGNVEIYVWKIGAPIKETAAPGTITISDVRLARAVAVAKKQWPDTLICTQNAAAAFLGQTEFTDMAKYGELAKNAMIRAEIGRVYDLQLIPSTVIPEHLALILRRKTGIVRLEKEGIRIQLDELMATDSTVIYGSETYGHGLKNADTVVAIVIAEGA